MHDVLIRGGKIVDGTGKPDFTDDVAIADGRIAARLSQARRRILTSSIMRIWA
jgi:N-acyl-D-aspartate/D-glutamate deacylase